MAKYNRILASVAMAAVIAPIGIGAMSFDISTANAQQVSVETLATMSADSTAKLNIHSYNGAPIGEAQDGQKLPDTSNLGSPKSTTFKVYKINGLDFRNFEDWKTFTELKPENIEASRDGSATLVKAKLGLSLQPADTDTITTDAGTGAGEAELPIGFYVVTQVAEDNLSTVAPFFLSLPMTNADGTLNKDVHVYPKNQKIGIEKEGNYDKTQAGGTADYDILADVPAPKAGNNNFTRYTIVDRQPSHIKADENTIKVSIVNGKEKENAVALEKGTDYDVRGSNNSANKNDIIIEFTETGREKLFNKYKEFKDNTKVNVTYTSNVDVDFGKNVNSIEELKQNNKAFLFTDGTFGDPDNPGEPGDPGDDSTVKFTNLKIIKQDGESKPIKTGADFQLYRCDTTADKPVTKGEALTVGNQSTWTTGNDGDITINGIKADDDTTDKVSYCLVETKAPEGYVLRPEPFLVNLTSDRIEHEAKIENLSNDSITGNLPRTGGAGMIALIMAGVLASGGAIAFMASSNRKKAKVTS